MKRHLDKSMLECKTESLAKKVKTEASLGEAMVNRFFRERTPKRKPPTPVVIIQPSPFPEEEIVQRVLKHRQDGFQGHGDEQFTAWLQDGFPKCLQKPNFQVNRLFTRQEPNQYCKSGIWISYPQTCLIHVLELWNYNPWNNLENPPTKIKTIIVKGLLDAKADIAPAQMDSKHNIHTYGILHSTYNLGVMRLVLEAKANPSHNCNWTLKNLLHKDELDRWCMDQGKEQVQLLLDYGADMNMENERGRNAITAAQPCWYEQMVAKHKQQLRPFLSVHLSADTNGIVIDYVVRPHGE